MDPKRNQGLEFIFVAITSSTVYSLPGIDELHNFVSVALHTTAGESDFDSDRLSNLKKVGNGFQPLIFGLMKNKSFGTFRQGCRAVWEALETDPDLPEKLVRLCAIMDVCLCFFCYYSVGASLS